MNADRYQQIKRTFDAVFELASSDRSARLDELCGEDQPLRDEVLRWLEHHDDTEDPPTVDPDDFSDLPPRSDRCAAGTRIGDYQVVRQIGKGGMGVVYLVEREMAGVRQQFALKVVLDRADRDEIFRRFDRERTILAGLAHDGIARLHDVGETDDHRPYFVMEYVEGAPLDEYCDQNALGVDERLAIFCRVCDAVQFAHGAQVVHRDLKPNNILVTADGRPKLLDFGIARYTNPILAKMDGVTIRSQPLTPQYASPEQVRHDAIVGTASDVYSLGVILYQLMSGHHPYRITSALEEEYRRIILTSQPQRPSVAATTLDAGAVSTDPTTERTAGESRGRRRRRTQLRRRLEGDIDNIVLMAMRKEPDRRYATAHALAEDLRRHLDGLPVTARPDTIGYRSGKFIRRHRLAFATASIIAVTLVAALVTTSIALARTRAAEATARARFTESWRLVQSLLDDDRALRTLIGGQLVREQIAMKAIAQLELLEADADAPPGVLVDLARGWRIVGEIAGSPRSEAKGDTEAALAHYARAEAALDRVQAASTTDDRDLVLERTRLARQQALVQTGATREETRGRAIALIEGRFGVDPSDLEAARLLMTLLNDRYAVERQDATLARSEALLARLDADPDSAHRVRRDRMVAMGMTVSATHRMAVGIATADTVERARVDRVRSFVDRHRADLETTAALLDGDADPSPAALVDALRADRDRMTAERVNIARTLYAERPQSTVAIRDLAQSLMFRAQYANERDPVIEGLPFARALHLLNTGIPRDRENLVVLLCLHADEAEPSAALEDLAAALELLASGSPTPTERGLFGWLLDTLEGKGTTATSRLIDEPSPETIAGPRSDPLHESTYRALGRAVVALDAMTAADAMRTGDPAWPAARATAMRIRLLLAKTHARQEENTAADALIDEVLDALNDGAWPERSPTRARLLADAVLTLDRANPADFKLPELRHEAIVAMTEAFGASPDGDEDRAMLDALRADAPSNP